MGIGTRVKVYTGKGWEAGFFRAFLDGQGLAKYRVYIPSQNACIAVPEMGIQRVA